MMECRQLWAGVTEEIGARRTNIIINIALGYVKELVMLL